MIWGWVDDWFFREVLDCVVGNDVEVRCLIEMIFLVWKVILESKFLIWLGCCVGVVVWMSEVYV